MFGKRKRRNFTTFVKEVVAQSAAHFVQLFRFVPLMVTIESQKVKKFFKSLRANIYDRVAMLRPSLYAEVLEHAQLVKNFISAKHQRIVRVRTQ